LDLQGPDSTPEPPRQPTLSYVENFRSTSDHIPDRPSGLAPDAVACLPNNDLWSGRMTRKLEVALKTRKQTWDQIGAKMGLRDIGMTVARCLIVRSLRQNNLHHTILGYSAVVGFIVHDSTDIDIYIRSVRYLIRLRSADKANSGIEVLHWDGTTPRSRRTYADADLREALSTNDHVFGFASSMEAFPPTFRMAAEGIVNVPPVDLAALRASVKNAGLHFIPDELLEKAIGAPLSLISALIKRRRNSQVILRNLTQLANRNSSDSVESPEVNGLRIEHLHGLGAAAVWGRQLAKDIASFRAGDLSWSDVDRGVLLMGPTGTGKTTFAQAVAKECGIPIHIHSLARWQSKGSMTDLLRAMRDAFEAARREAPCILFIDEFDSFGDRSTFSGHNEGYEREVVNAMLECLDGGDGREGVVVVGATNLPDKIDRAMLRPGRLGKHIRISLPDLAARVGILRHYLGEATISDGLADIAERLDGASGAEIEQVVRDARRHARSEQRPVMLCDIERSLPPRVAVSEDAFVSICAHEAGHVIVGHLLGNEAGRVFIEARALREVDNDGTGGFTTMNQIPTLRRRKPQYLAQITILLAGLAAETHLLGDSSDAGGGDSDSDLSQATLIAATMDVSLGLDRSLVYLSSRDPIEILAIVRADVDLRGRVSEVLDVCLRRARTLIEENHPLFVSIFQVLKEHGKITALDLRRIIDVPSASV
jgi:DNA polymerase III delta prime subunit